MTTLKNLIALILLIWATICIAEFPPDSPDVWYVSDDGDDTTGLTWATAFDDLEDVYAALAAADGDIVYISNGTYATSTSNPADVLHLIGSSSEYTILDADTSNTNTLLFGPGKGVLIKHIFFKGDNQPGTTGEDGGQGLGLSTSDSGRVENCQLIAGQDALIASSAENWIFRDSFFKARWDAVQLNNSKNMGFFNCRIISTGDYKGGVSDDEPSMESGRAVTGGTSGIGDAYFNNCKIEVASLETGVKPITGSSSDIRGFACVHNEGSFYSFDQCEFTMGVGTTRFYPQRHVVAVIRNSTQGTNPITIIRNSKITGGWNNMMVGVGKNGASTASYGVYVEEGTVILENCVIAAPSNATKNPEWVSVIPGTLDYTVTSTTGTPTTSFIDSDLTVLGNDFLVGATLEWLTGDNDDVITQVIDVNGATGEVTLLDTMSSNIDTSDTYRVRGQGYYDIYVELGAACIAINTVYDRTLVYDANNSDTSRLAPVTNSSRYYLDKLMNDTEGKIKKFRGAY